MIFLEFTFDYRLYETINHSMKYFIISAAVFGMFAMPLPLFEEGELRPVTQFDKKRQESLGVAVRPVPEILRDAIEELKKKGEL